jgi:hypothetical protein
MTARREGSAERSVRLTLPFLAVLGVFGAWWLSDRLIFIGPIDRATFGWGVVIPLWVLLPVIAAVAWAGLDDRARTAAASLLGTAVAVTAAAWFWRGLDPPDCQFGTLRTAADWLAPVAVVAGVIGVGLAASSITASNRSDEGRRIAAVVVGVALQIGAVAVSLLLAIVLFSGPACQRPPAG